MTFSQFVALLAFLSAALPLGAMGMITLLYAAVAAGRAPVEAAVLFERLAGRGYCWTMIGILALAFLLIGGLSPRLLLLLVIASFVRAVLDLLPWLDSVQAGGTALDPGAGPGRARGLIAAACAVQWLTVLVVYGQLVL